MNILTSSTSTVGLLPPNLYPRAVAPSGNTLLLLLLLLFALWSSIVLRRLRTRLPGEGLIPRFASGLHVFVRAGAILLGLELIAKLLPDALTPALPWVLVAAAAAVGWSARDLLPDVLAGIVLGIERSVRVGDWVTGEEISGMVERIGLRSSAILDARGRRLTVPNRHLVGRTVAADRSPWPEVDVTLSAPERAAPRDFERLVRETALALPWVAPFEVSVARTDGGYRVRARVLEGRFIDLFTSALRERVDEARDM